MQTKTEGQKEELENGFKGVPTIESEVELVDARASGAPILVLKKS